MAPGVGMSLGGRDDVLGAAIITSVDIAVRALIGALVSLLVGPGRAEARSERRLRGALRATALRPSDALGEVAGAVMGRRERGDDGQVQASKEGTWLAAEPLDAAKFVDGAAEPAERIGTLDAAPARIEASLAADDPPRASTTSATRWPSACARCAGPWRR